MHARKIEARHLPCNHLAAACRCTGQLLRTVHAQEFEGIPYFLPKRVPLRPMISGRQNLIVDDRALAGHCPVVLAVTGSNTSTNEFVGTEDARNAIQYAVASCGWVCA